MIVGRAAELAVVRAAVDRVPAGQGGVLLVTGEAGIGKSRLLDDVDRRAAELGLRRLAGRAVPGGGTYRPLAEAVSGQWDAALRRAPEELRPYRAALAGLVPGEVGGDGPAGDVDPVVLLGEGLRRLLLAVTDGGRGCLVRLEDLHWADDDTVGLVEHLAAALTDTPVLLAVSARDEPPTRTTRRLAASPGVTTVRLTRLGEADVAALAAACRGGAPLSAAEVRALMARSEGLPFVVEEMLAAPGASVPPTLAALVTDRLDHLPPTARDVLAAAAVLGPELDWRLLGPVTGAAEPEVLRALRAGVDVGLLAVDGEALRWPHALTRDAVLASLLPPERAAVSARAAAVLRARAGPDDELRAAQLHVDAGHPVEAARLLLDLARRATSRGALRSAEHLLETAAMAHPDPEVDDERVRVLTHVGRVEDALALGAPLVDRRTGRAHAELCLQLARTAIGAGRWADAESYVHRAGRPDDPRSAVLLADAAFGAGRVDDAEALARDAVATAERAGAPGPLCEALGVVARTLWHTDLAGTSAAFARAAQVAAEHGLTPERVIALFGSGMLEALDADDWPTLWRARELALDAGMLAQVASIDVVLTDVVMMADGPRAAAPVARRAAEAAAQLRLPELGGPANVQLAVCLAAVGDAAGAAALLGAVHRWELMPGELSGFVALAEGVGALVEHDLVRAASRLDAAASLALLHRTAPLLAPVGAWALLRAVTDTGPDEARSTLQARAGGLSRPIKAALEYAAAVTAGREGRPAEAAERLAAGDDRLATRPWWRRLLRLVVLECAVADGWGDPVPELRADLAAHEAAGDELLARTCRDVLRRAGTPVKRQRGTAVPPRLRALGVTSREMEVLVLVARGMTNAEVADRLVLSRRTVETHVARLLAKTGSATRAQLRAWAGETG